jgi:hypothetical protein
MSKNAKLKFSIILGLLSLFAIFQLLKTGDPCAKPPERHVIIIDGTDQLGNLTVDGIKSKLKELTEKAAVGARFKLVFIGGDPPSSKTITTCRPETSTLSNAEKKIQREWQDFNRILFDPLDNRPKSSPSSPIYETILDEARTEFQGFSGKKILTVISDWRQYSPGKLNLHHECEDPKKAFTALSESLLVRVSLTADRPLANVAVHRLLIPRDDMSEKFTKCVLQVADMFINTIADKNTKLPEDWRILARSPAASK